MTPHRPDHPLRPPLVKGGQGREPESLQSDAKAITYLFAFGALAFALGLLWGLLG